MDDRLRVRIKDKDLRFKAVVELIARNFKTKITNPDGDCLYIWTDGQKKCWVHHWTNDNPITDVDKTNFEWLKNEIKKL